MPQEIIIIDEKWQDRWSGVEYIRELRPDYEDSMLALLKTCDQYGIRAYKKVESEAVLKTQEELDQEKDSFKISLFNKLRSERNKLLVKTDWTQLSDSPPQEKNYPTYRQALRDLPDTIENILEFNFETDFPTLGLE